MAIGVLGNWLLGVVHLVPALYQTPMMKTYTIVFAQLQRSFWGQRPLPG